MNLYPQYPNAQIGEGTIIEENVQIGMQYHPACGKAEIGPHSIIRAGSIIYGDVKTGVYFQTGHYAVIRARVEIGDYCTIFNQATIEGMVRIGSGVRVMSHVYIPSRTVIGDRVIIGPGTTFLNEMRPGRCYPMEHPIGAVIEDDVTIGGGCVILPGVRIGAHSFIAAGAVVTKDIPPRSMVKGFPGRATPLPEDMDVGNNPEMVYAPLDIWHPAGEDPALAWWPEGRGPAPMSGE